MAEPGFMDAVVNDIPHFKAQTASVIEAVRLNALDCERADQMVWVAAFGEIVGLPATEALRALIPE